MKRISKIECAHCLEVKNIFSDFIKAENDFCVVDAYPFGYAVLEWFNEKTGFDNQTFFSSASDLFDYLLEYWERIMVYRLSSADGNQNLKELKERLSENQIEELSDTKNAYIMQYENVAMLWDNQESISDDGIIESDCDWVYAMKKWLSGRSLYNSQVDENAAKRAEGKVFSLSEHVQGMVYSLLSNQRPWSGIVDHIVQIDDIFFQYDVEKIKSTDGRDFVEKLCAIKCGNRNIAAQMKNLKSNIMILKKLEDEYGSVDRFITSEPSYLIVQKLSDGKSEYKLHNMGESLVWEYLRNVGIDGAKPDVHLRRFFGGDRMGRGNHSPATTQEVYDAVLDISQTTGFSMAQIDSLVWNFCADDFGEICSANPRCRDCVIRKSCNNNQ